MPKTLTAGAAQAAVSQAAALQTSTIIATVLKAARSIFVKGLVGGWGEEKTAKEMQKALPSFSSKSHKAGADVALTAVYNAGVYSGAVEAGVQFLMFAAVVDDSTTDICKTMNGVVIPIELAPKYMPPLHWYCRSRFLPTSGTTGKSLSKSVMSKFARLLPDGFGGSIPFGKVIASSVPVIFSLSVADKLEIKTWISETTKPKYTKEIYDILQSIGTEIRPSKIEEMRILAAGRLSAAGYPKSYLASVDTYLAAYEALLRGIGLAG